MYPGLWIGGADVWELRHPDEWGEEAGGRSRSEGTDGQVVIPDGRQNLHEYLATELGVDLRAGAAPGRSERPVARGVGRRARDRTIQLRS